MITSQTMTLEEYSMLEVGECKRYSYKLPQAGGWLSIQKRKRDWLEHWKTFDLLSQRSGKLSQSAGKTPVCRKCWHRPRLSSRAWSRSHARRMGRLPLSLSSLRPDCLRLLIPQPIRLFLLTLPPKYIDSSSFSLFGVDTMGPQVDYCVSWLVSLLSPSPSHCSFSRLWGFKNASQITLAR